MRLYDGEGRHEEQSGSGRQADITNRAQMMMMMTGMIRNRATLIVLVVKLTRKTVIDMKILRFTSDGFSQRELDKSLEENLEN